MPDIEDGMKDEKAARKKNKKYVQMAVKSQRKETLANTVGR